jgi:hypothetical protein
MAHCHDKADQAFPRHIGVNKSPNLRSFGILDLSLMGERDGEAGLLLQAQTGDDA